MRRIVWERHARADLRAIRAYIAKDDPAAADRWVERLVATAMSATHLPTPGRMVPEAAREDVREVLLRTYRIIFRVRADCISVVLVSEGSRLLSSILRTRLE